MARWFFGAALVLALLGDTALWNVRAGPGWLLLTAAVAAVSHWARVRLERPFSPWTAALWLVASAFALSPALYDADLVHQLSGPLCLVSLLLAVHFTVVGRCPLEALVSQPVLGKQALMEAWATQRDLTTVRSSPSVTKGLLLSVPILAVFAGLFLMADPAFEGFVTRRLLGGEEWLARLLRLQLWVLLLAAVFFQAQRCTPRGQEATGTGDPTSAAVALGLTCVLFLAFLVCQARYLFSGYAPEGMTLAEYARHGFFELFVACILVVLLTVAVHGWVYAHPEPGPARLSNLALVALTFGLVASSLQRMLLYVQHFGMTTTRAYVLLTLLGMVATLLLCLRALASWQPPAWLRARLLLLGMLTMAMTGLCNIEAWVARTNLRLPEVDLAYLSTLSCDVIPELNLADPAQRQVADSIRQRRPGRDWRTWNWSQQTTDAWLENAPPLRSPAAPPDRKD